MVGNTYWVNISYYPVDICHPQTQLRGAPNTEAGISKSTDSHFRKSWWVTQGSLSFDRLENYIIERLHLSTNTSLNRLYTIFQVIQLIRPWQSALSLLLDWDLLSNVIHTEIVLLTREEVFWAVIPTPHCTFTV
jgi:hypothetical protein